MVAIAVKLSDLSAKERARVEKAAGANRGLHVVHKGKVYEALGFSRGIVMTRHLNGDNGPQLPRDQVEILERD